MACDEGDKNSMAVTVGVEKNNDENMVKSELKIFTLYLCFYLFLLNLHEVDLT